MKNQIIFKQLIFMIFVCFSIFCQAQEDALIQKDALIKAIRKTDLVGKEKKIKKNTEKLEKLIIKEKMNINYVSIHGVTALHCAVIKKNYEGIIEKLLIAGADINAVDFYDETPVLLAMLVNNNELAKYLIEAGAKMEYGYFGRTILFLAIEKNQTEMVEFLISKGANVNSRDYLGETVIQKAARNGNLDICEILLNNKADLSLASKDSRLPIHTAALYDNFDVIRLLLKSGSKICISTKSEKALYSSAKLYKFLAQIEAEKGNAPLSKAYFKEASILFNSAEDTFNLQYERYKRDVNTQILKENIYAVISSTINAYQAQESSHQMNEIVAMRNTMGKGGSFDDYVAYKKTLGNKPVTSNSTTSSTQLDFHKFLRDAYNETSKSCKSISDDCSQKMVGVIDEQIEKDECLYAEDINTEISNINFYVTYMGKYDVLLDGTVQYLIPFGSKSIAKVRPGIHNFWAGMHNFKLRHTQILVEAGHDYYIGIGKDRTTIIDKDRAIKLDQRKEIVEELELTFNLFD